MTNILQQSKIKIDELEKDMFNALWEMYENRDKLGDFPMPPEKMLADFVQYLSLKYRFDPNNFSIYDKKGQLIHSRVQKPKEFVN